MRKIKNLRLEFAKNVVIASFNSLLVEREQLEHSLVVLNHPYAYGIVKTSCGIILGWIPHGIVSAIYGELCKPSRLAPNTAFVSFETGIIRIKYYPLLFCRQ